MLSTQSPRTIPDDGLTLTDFVRGSPREVVTVPRDKHGQAPTFHLMTYGCQMNVNDSEIVRSLLLEAGLRECDDESQAKENTLVSTYEKCVMGRHCDKALVAGEEGEASKSKDTCILGMTEESDENGSKDAISIAKGYRIHVSRDAPRKFIHVFTWS